MSACRRDFDKTKYMSFLIKHNGLLQKYNKICKTVSSSIKKEFDTVYNEKYLKTKLKSYNGKISTNYQNQHKIPKEGSQCIYVSVILTDSIFRKEIKTIILKCFYKNVNILVVKEKKMYNYIADDMNISSDDSDREDSDYSDKENSNVKVSCAGKHKKPFSFVRKLLFQEIRVNLCIFALEFKKFTKQTKSTVIPYYENFFIRYLIRSFTGV